MDRFFRMASCREVESVNFQLCSHKSVAESKKFPHRTKNLSVNNIPPFAKGTCEKIRLMHEKNSSLVQGRGKFTPPKPAGDTELQGIPSSSAKRRPQSDDNLRKTKGFSFRIRPSLIPRRQRRTQRLFWRREFSPPLDMVWFSNFPIPEFFHSFRGVGGIFPKRSKANPPMSPFFKGGFNRSCLSKDKL